MFARIRETWQAWRERSRQAAVDRAVYKAGGAGKKAASRSDISDKYGGPPDPPDPGGHM
jgi:hypothetical protein